MMVEADRVAALVTKRYYDKCFDHGGGVLERFCESCEIHLPLGPQASCLRPVGLGGRQVRRGAVGVTRRLYDKSSDYGDALRQSYKEFPKCFADAASPHPSAFSLHVPGLMLGRGTWDRVVRRLVVPDLSP